MNMNRTGGGRVVDEEYNGDNVGVGSVLLHRAGHRTVRDKVLDVLLKLENIIAKERDRKRKK